MPQHSPTSTSTSSQQSQQSLQGNLDVDWAQESEYNQMLRKEKIDQLIELASLKVGGPWLLEGTWSGVGSVSYRRKQQVKQYISCGIYSVLSTIASQVDQHAEIWKDVKASNSVDKMIQGSPVASNLLKEVIKAWNSCGNR